jgi:hypothetical protein
MTQESHPTVRSHWKSILLLLTRVLESGAATLLCTALWLRASVTQVGWLTISAVGSLLILIPLTCILALRVEPLKWARRASVALHCLYATWLAFEFYRFLND